MMRGLKPLSVEVVEGAGLEATSAAGERARVKAELATMMSVVEVLFVRGQEGLRVAGATMHRCSTSRSRGQLSRLNAGRQ